MQLLEGFGEKEEVAFCLEGGEGDVGGLQFLHKKVKSEIFNDLLTKKVYNQKYFLCNLK